MREVSAERLVKARPALEGLGPRVRRMFAPRALLRRAKDLIRLVARSVGRPGVATRPRAVRLALLDFQMVPGWVEGAALAVVSPRATAELELSLNGQRYTASLIRRAGPWSWYFLPSGLLEPGENVVAVGVSHQAVVCCLSPVWVGVPSTTGATRTGVVPRDWTGTGGRVWPEVGPMPHFAGEVAAVADYSTPEAASVSFLRSAISAPGTRFRGTAPGCYDLDNQCYRLWSWIWTNGAVIAGLLEPAASGQPHDLGLATALGERLLSFQIREGTHAGAFPVRWDLDVGTEDGIADWLAPNDSAFLASNGLVRLYDLTGRSDFRDAALATARWVVEEGMEDDGRLRLGFRRDAGEWVRDWLYVDAGFTASLLRDAFRLTGETRWVVALNAFLSWYVERLFDRRRGAFVVSVVDDCRRPVRRLFARGQGWGLDGLLAGWEATGENAYLEIGRRVGDTLLRYQSRSGAWPYDLRRPWTGACNKGTPILAYHLLRLGSALEEPRYLDGAERALDWCCGAQVRPGPRAPRAAWGGIAGSNEEGAISGVRWVRTVFPYASAYYLMARALQRGNSRRDDG